jgi:hypothetical protein
MNLPEAMTTLARAEMSTDAADAVITVLAELDRLRALEREFARRLVPEVVATYGERSTVATLQGLVPRLYPNPPTRRGSA